MYFQNVVNSNTSYRFHIRKYPILNYDFKIAVWGNIFVWLDSNSNKSPYSFDVKIGLLYKKVKIFENEKSYFTLLYFCTIF